MQTNKQQEIEKKQKQYLSNSEQVNAVARNRTSQIAYMPLLTIGLSNFAYSLYKILDLIVVNKSLSIESRRRSENSIVRPDSCVQIDYQITYCYQSSHYGCPCPVYT